MEIGLDRKIGTRKIGGNTVSKGIYKYLPCSLLRLPLWHHDKLITHLEILCDNGVYGGAGGRGGSEGGEEHHAGHHTHTPAHHRPHQPHLTPPPHQPSRSASGGRCEKYKHYNHSSSS